MTAPATVPAPTAGAGRPGHLTPRQRQILAYVACGLPDTRIGARIGIQGSSVKTSLRRAYRTLGARNRAHAVIIALRSRQITLHDIDQAAHR
ncbi:helix-turn-helix domain-containing protein [Actinoplanes rectilineatus]|uniref:helix-turn-helix domain-containing protein n=1 Tax=Actinoplanes rectilineatus TaxID=113571 RepID=UPI000698EC97|nr:helix-turn-helix transcriptional regulator [Actinoplanes rectilineatus]